MKNVDKKTVARVVIPLIIALISVFGLTKYASSAEFHAKTIESLDEKKTTVMELTAASTAASITVSMLPDDIGTAISDKLMDLSGYFLIVLSALYLEKYLLTITGYAAFALLIPLACILFSVSVFWKRELLKSIGKRLALFGLAIVLVIPVSMKISDLIESTYESSIEKTIESAKETTEELEDSVEKDEGFIKGIISKVKGGVSGIIKKMETSLNNFIESLAVMLVTSCAIPILVLLFFVWLIKVLLNVNIPVNVNSVPKLSSHVKKRREDL